MMTTTTSAPEADPSLAALVPRPSRARNALLVLGAVAAVVVASWLGAAVSLSLQPRGAALDLLPGGSVAYAVTMDAPHAPGMRLTEVRAPQGTTLAGVWVLSADDPDPLAGAPLAGTVAALEASGRPSALPQPVTPGELRVVLLLTVDDCTLLEDDAAQGTVVADGSILSVPPSVTVTSFLGSASSIDLDWYGWPRADLVAAGACG